MPKPCPTESCDDIVSVAGSRVPGEAIKRMAADFGVHPVPQTTWLARSRAEETAPQTS